MHSIGGRRRSASIALLAGAGMLFSCSSAGGPETGEPATDPTSASESAPEPSDAATATPSSTPKPSTPAEPTTTAPTSTNEPTTAEPPDARPQRCRGLSEDEVTERVDALGADIEEVMEGYDGEWAFGMVDLDCDVELAVNEEWSNYPASAGKIVPIIAALRAVEDGGLELEDFEDNLLGVMTHSWDADANVINDLVTPEQVQEVLEIAEVSDVTDFEYRWHRADMPPLDLARVWEALLDGRLLEEEQAEYLLDLAEGPEIPPGLDTFPIDPQMPGWQLGQKAGYWVSSGTPYFLLGAGYLRPEPGSEAAQDQQGIAVVLHIRSLNEDLHEPQRREVFPLIREYADPDAG